MHAQRYVLDVDHDHFIAHHILVVVTIVTLFCHKNNFSNVKFHAELISGHVEGLG